MKTTEVTMTETPWYQNPLPGFSVYDNTDVILLPRKQGSDTRNATKQYTEMVLDEEQRLRDEGWTGYIAPENHGDDKGKGDAWHWDTENPGMFLEAIYYDADVSLETVQAQYQMHNGQAWQYPTLFCFTDAPSQAILTYLSNGGCPVAYLDDMEVDVEEPDEPDQEIDWQIIAIQRLIHIGDMHDEIQDVIQDAVYLRKNFRTLRKRRRYIRTEIIEALREVINA